MGVTTIRRAAVGDATALARVRVLSWQAAYRGMMPDRYLDALDIDENAARFTGFLSEYSAHSHWVGVVDDEVVAWASACVTARDTELDASVGELAACYVLASAWGSGVGFKIWKAVLAELVSQGVSQVIVWVLTQNIRALSFYERQGFVKDGQRKTTALTPDIQLEQARLCLDI